MTQQVQMSLDDFSRSLEVAAARRRARLDEIQRELSLRQVFLFGYGGKGRALARDIQRSSTTKVVVYDSSPERRCAARLDGFETVEDRRFLSEGGYGVILGACQAQMEQAALISRNIIFYQEAAYLFDAPHLASTARSFSTWAGENVESLYEIFSSVQAASRDAFHDVVRFRLSLDPTDLAGTRRDNDDMWFDIVETCVSRQYRTFLDVGAYDGDTLRKAAKRLGITRGIAVEANRALVPSIEEASSTYPQGVQILAHAAWSHPCRLRVSEVRGGMISVSEATDGDLEAAPLDDGVREHVDWIKMDIEGAELPALRGSARILAVMPDLALAAYHRPEDLCELPAFLQDKGYTPPGFDLHVGHYSDCFDDTIFYWLRADAAE